MMTTVEADITVLTFVRRRLGWRTCCISLRFISCRGARGQWSLATASFTMWSTPLSVFFVSCNWLRACTRISLKNVLTHMSEYLFISSQSKYFRYLQYSSVWLIVTSKACLPLCNHRLSCASATLQTTSLEWKNYYVDVTPPKKAKPIISR